MKLILSRDNVFKTSKGTLYIDGISTINLTGIYDTPLYVISEKKIRENYNRLKTSFSEQYKKIRIYYSAKANTNLSVLKILETEGSFLDTVSPGEVFLSLNAGFSPERILFTGTSVRDNELQYLLDLGVTINVDSYSELRRLLNIKIPEILSIRVNPEFGAGHHNHVITAGSQSKFGLLEEDVLKAYKNAKDAGVNKFGIHMHIGSGILTIEPYLLATSRLMDIAGRVKKELNIDFDFVDIGGGFGVPYRKEDKPLNLKNFCKQIVDLFNQKIEQHSLGKPSLYVEPGRFIVCEAGLLLTSVNTVKITPTKRFIGVDAGFNNLIRPAMYGSFHKIVVANKVNAPLKYNCDVAGPICESGDLLAKNLPLPDVCEGDVLAILNTGAYGFSMSSQYNSRPRCAEVLVYKNRHFLVRDRENYDTLLRNQKFPPWLDLHQ